MTLKFARHFDSSDRVSTRDHGTAGAGDARTGALLGTKVLYFLHPTFPNQPRTPAFGDDGRAPLELYAYGALTAGALLEHGTMLELNLATSEAAPARFRSK